MKPDGIQHILEFIDCKPDLLNRRKTLEAILEEGIEEAGLHSVRVKSHKFEPVGVTVMAIISESHISIHTYPEARHASIDIFTCSDGEKHATLIEFLKERLQPSEVKSLKINRGFEITINDQ